MIERSTEFSPDWVSPPGDTISDLMEERDWSQTELSGRLGISLKHLNQLIKGKVSLTYDIATRLERVLGSTLSFWINRESKYREHLARLENENQYQSWVGWLDQIPVKELQKIGVYEIQTLTQDVKSALVPKLLSFFGVASPQEWDEHYASMNAFFRRGIVGTPDVGATATWLRLGELRAEQIETPKYNRLKFERNVKLIRELTVEKPEYFVPKMTTLCNEAGVKFLLVQSIKKACVSGVARWLNGHSPLIQLSLYGRYNDKFWFSFFHEAAHILLHAEQKKAIFLDDVDLSGHSKEEGEANEWAANLLLPLENPYDLWSLSHSEEIVEFSKSYNIHPGVVVGRLQHDKQVSHASKELNNLKEKINMDQCEIV